MKLIVMFVGGVAALAMLLRVWAIPHGDYLVERGARVVVTPTIDLAMLTAPQSSRTIPVAAMRIPAGPSMKSGMGARDNAGALLGTLADEVRREERDSPWADRSEEHLKTRLSRISPYGAAPAFIDCRRTLCEIVGSVPGSFGTERMNSLLQALQGADMRAALPDANLIGGPAVTHRSNDGDRYTIFYKRQAS